MPSLLERRASTFQAAMPRIDSGLSKARRQMTDGISSTSTTASQHSAWTPSTPRSSREVLQAEPDEASDATASTAPAKDSRSLLQRRRAALGIKLQQLSINCDLATEAAKRRNPFQGSFGEVAAKYDLLSALGQGSTAVVHLARDRGSGEDVALKVMRMQDEELLQHARSEFETLRRLDHPHIIRALDFFTYSMGAVLVLEHFDGRSLEEAVDQAGSGRFAEAQARSLFGALAGAVDHWHQHGIIHRDVKAQNILVSADLRDLRVIDFNVAHASYEGGGALTMTGTADWMPPEVLLGQSLAASSDVWAAGLCLRLMLFGALPIERQLFSSHRDFGKALLNRQSSLLPSAADAGVSVSEPCLDVLRRCLEVNPDQRPSSAQLLDCAWLKNGV